MVDTIHRPGRISEGLWVCKVFLHRRPKIQEPQFDKSEPEIFFIISILVVTFMKFVIHLSRSFKGYVYFLKFPIFRDMMSCRLVD